MTLRFAAMIAALAALLVVGAGCGRSVSKTDFKETLVNEVNLSEPVADCVIEELFRNLDEEQVEHVYRAALADLTTQERRAVNAAAVLCVSGGRATTATTTAPDE